MGGSEDKGKGKSKGKEERSKLAREKAGSGEEGGEEEEGEGEAGEEFEMHTDPGGDDVDKKAGVLEVMKTTLLQN